MIATHEDLPALLRMGRAFCEALGEDCDTGTMQATAVNLIDNPMGVMLVEDGGMAGALCYPHFFNASRLIAQELFWWVEPGARGRGVGVKLLHDLEQWALNMGAERLLMVSMASLPNVGVLYERKGYRAFEQTWIKELQWPSERLRQSSAGR